MGTSGASTSSAATSVTVADVALPILVNLEERERHVKGDDEGEPDECGLTERHRSSLEPRTGKRSAAPQSSAFASFISVSILNFSNHPFSAFLTTL